MAASFMNKGRRKQLAIYVYCDGHAKIPQNSVFNKAHDHGGGNTHILGFRSIGIRDISGKYIQDTKELESNARAPYIQVIVAQHGSRIYQWGVVVGVEFRKLS